MANLTDIRSNWSTGASEGGVTVYATKENLPATGLTSGDQAYVTNTSRLYISNGSGWYNVALINATPSLTIDPTGAIELSKEGASTVITLTATDSDNAVAGLTFSVDSDGSFGGLATISQDSSVFTITPLSADSATTSLSTLTFKASDGISFGSGQRTLSLSFATVNSNYTTFLAKADTAGTDNQVDASSIGRTITEGGNITSSAFTPYHPGGYSAYFDGTGDYLTTPTSADFAYGTGDFTIEAWVNIPSAPSNYKYILGQATVSTGLGLYIQSGVYRLYGGSALIVQSSVGYTLNVWQHIAIARSGTTLKMFLNGAEVGSVTNTLNFASGSSNGLTIGMWAEAPDTESWLGYIRDVRVVKGTAVYTSAFTPPTEPLTAIANTSLLACHAPYIADGSTNGHAITVNGNTSTKRFGPYDYYSYNKTDYGGSIFNDGTGDYMTTPADTTHLTMAGDFTIDFWYYPTAAKLNGYVYGKYNNNTDAWTIFVTPNYSSGNLGYLSFYYGNYGSNESATNLRSNPITLNAWHYCRITRESGVFYMSVNGKVGTRSNYGANGLSWSDTRTFNANTTIGISGQTGYTLGEAYLADLRVINGTALTTSDFTPPTAPVSAVTNTKLLTCTNKNDIWDTSSGDLLTKAGDVTASNTQRQFTGSSAIYFDGNGDYLDFVQKDGYSFESGVDFTVEGWWYMNSIAGRPHFIGMGTGIDGTPAHYSDWNMYYNSGNSLTFYYYNGSTAIARQFAWTPVINTWYHIAVSRSGTDLKAFINGTQIGSTITDSTNFSGAAGTRPLRIGRWQYGGGTNAYLNGYAQDIRITKGLARYTANFTPPTTEFDG